MKYLTSLKMRLPGGILYESFIRASKLRYSSDDLLELALLQKVKALRASFFRGCSNPFSGGINAHYLDCHMRIYQALCSRFASAEIPECFDFNGIKLPYATTENERFVFACEASDFLMYDIVENKELCDAATCEGPYEFGDVRIQSGDVVIDAGANKGMFSAMASHKGATVYAFEPADHVVDQYLSKTAAWNPNIHICKYALSDKREQLQFKLYPDDTTVGHLIFDQTNELTQNVQTVQAIPLDDFAHENNLSSVDFIKADIEGAERFMLMGARGVLKEFAPKIAICTYHTPDDPKVLRELILQANPTYVIEEKWQRMYAHVPQ